MSTPIPRPPMSAPGQHLPGPGQQSSVAGQSMPAPGPRPGIPLPGQHVPGVNQEFADPVKVRADVDALLTELSAGARDSVDDGTDMVRRARILEQAHDVLVRALATVDKI